MIPILYESNETAFTSQGIGALAESTSASVSRVLNGKDELVLVYPCTGVRYADLQNDRIIFAQPEYKKSAQPYQIYKISKPLNGLVTVYARHVGTQRAKYIPVAPFEAGSVIQAFNDLPTYLKESNPFTFWTDKNTVANFKMTVPASLGSVLGGMEGSILDVYGGEYEFDGYTIKLWSRRGSDGGVELRYGKNITNIEHNEDFDEIVTGVVPYWEGMDDEVVYLPEIVVEGPYADQYSFRRSVIKDFTEAFEDKPSVSDLRSAAQNYIAQTGISLPKVDLSVNFEHLAQYTEYEGIALLEQLNLGDSVSIYYEPLGVSATARIVKTNYDCLTEKYISVQIGSVKNDLALIMSAQANTAQELKNAISKTLPSAIEEAVEHVTDLITGAEGGYVVLDRDANGKPYQILIMDTDSKNTATNVIRLNRNGIGFSTSGYSGPYTTAWTIDSNFVADFITTGNFNASLAKIGILQDAAGKNSWNMQTGAFAITDGSINITTNTADRDLIRLAYGSGSSYEATIMTPSYFWAYRGNNYDEGIMYADDYIAKQIRVVDSNNVTHFVNTWEIRQYNPSEPNTSTLELGSKSTLYSANGVLNIYHGNSNRALYFASGMLTISDANGVDGIVLNAPTSNGNSVGGYVAIKGSDGASNIYLNANNSNGSPLIYLRKTGDTRNSVEISPTGFRLYDASSGTNVVSINSSGYIYLGASGTAGHVYVRDSSGNNIISLSGSTGTVSASKISLTNGTQTASINPAINGTGLAWYNGSSKYTFLMWPDSNGAGRIVLGDGTGTLWRTTLDNTGLTFRNSSDVVTANFPSDGMYFMDLTATSGLNSTTIVNLLNANNSSIPSLKLVVVRITYGGNQQLLLVNKMSNTYGGARCVGYFGIINSFDNFKLVNSTWEVITYNSAFSDGGSWYVARAIAAFRNVSTPSNATSYWPTVDMKTPSGDWSIGTLGERIRFVYTTNAHYNAGQNYTVAYNLPDANPTSNLSYEILTSNTGALKPTHQFTGGTYSSATTSYKYTGYSVTIPSGKCFLLTIHAYYSTVEPASVCISTSSTSLTSGAIQYEANVDSLGTRARGTFGGYADQQYTYYLWVKGRASGSVGVSIDSFYFS